MLAIAWGLACGAGAYALLARTAKLLHTAPERAILPLILNMLVIGLCLAACALVAPKQLYLAGSALSGTLALCAIARYLYNRRRTRHDANGEDTRDV
ncbi:MAG: hypothetical protein LBN26_03095 [Christensenellaceae bacterium]|nr:hypothetical protein [Christensenellaceae bacterium]